MDGLTIDITMTASAELVRDLARRAVLEYIIETTGAPISEDDVRIDGIDRLGEASVYVKQSGDVIVAMFRGKERQETLSQRLDRYLDETIADLEERVEADLGGVTSPEPTIVGFDLGQGDTTAAAIVTNGRIEAMAIGDDAVKELSAVFDAIDGRDAEEEPDLYETPRAPIAAVVCEAGERERSGDVVAPLTSEPPASPAEAQAMVKAKLGASEADEPDDAGWTLREDALIAKLALQGLNEGGMSREPKLSRRKSRELRERKATLISDFGDLKEAAAALNRMVAEIDAQAAA